MTFLPNQDGSVKPGGGVGANIFGGNTQATSLQDLVNIIINQGGAPNQAESQGGGVQPSNGGGLLQVISELAQSVSGSGNNQVETANIGGTNLLVNRTGPDISGGLQNLSQTLADASRQKIAQQKRENRTKFVDGVKTIMSSTAKNEDKVDSLLKLKIEHGTDYDLGVDDIVDQFNKRSDREIKSSSGLDKVSDKDKFLGQLETGNFEIQGIEFPIRTEKEARDRAARKFGPNYATRFPDIEEKILEKFGPDDFGFRSEEERVFQGKPFIYIGNDTWLPKKEFEKRQKNGTL